MGQRILRRGIEEFVEEKSGCEREEKGGEEARERWKRAKHESMSAIRHLSRVAMSFVAFFARAAEGDGGCSSLPMVCARWGVVIGRDLISALSLFLSYMTMMNVRDMICHSQTDAGNVLKLRSGFENTFLIYPPLFMNEDYAR